MNKKGAFMYAATRKKVEKWVTLWEGNQDAVSSPSFTSTSSTSGSYYKDVSGGAAYTTTIPFTASKAKFRITTEKNSEAYGYDGYLIVDNQDVELTVDESTGLFGLLIKRSGSATEKSYTEINVYRDKWTTTGKCRYSERTNGRYAFSGYDFKVLKIEASF